MKEYSFNAILTSLKAGSNSTFGKHIEFENIDNVSSVYEMIVLRSNFEIDLDSSLGTVYKKSLNKRETGFSEIKVLIPKSKVFDKIIFDAFY